MSCQQTHHCPAQLQRRAQEQRVLPRQAAPKPHAAPQITTTITASKWRRRQFSSHSIKLWPNRSTEWGTISSHIPQYTPAQHMAQKHFLQPMALPAQGHLFIHVRWQSDYLGTTHQLRMQLPPPPPLLAVSKESSPTRKAEGALQAQRWLLSVVLLKGDRWNNATNCSSGTGPRGEANTDITRQNDGGARKEWSTRAGFVQQGLEEQGFIRPINHIKECSQKEESNHPTVCFSFILLLPIRLSPSSPDRA